VLRGDDRGPADAHEDVLVQLAADPAEHPLPGDPPVVTGGVTNAIRQRLVEGKPQSLGLRRTVA